MSSDKRVVLDTSTLIGAILKPQSVPAQALAFAIEHAEILASPETLDELARVLRRDYLDRYRSVAERDAFYQFYAEAALLLESVEPLVACRDPKDDKFLALAVAGGASVIITSDEDLLVLQPFRGIPILSARAFVDLCLAP
jgi:putative PIN family toxin of toxin-antitoxin system